MKKAFAVLSVILTLCIALSSNAFALTVDPVFQVTNRNSSVYGDSLADAYSKAENGATIVLLGNRLDYSTSSPLTVSKKITLTTEKTMFDGDRPISYTGSGSFITVESGGDLTVNYAVLKGKTSSSLKKGGLIYVKKGGKLTVNKEAVLQNSVLSAGDSLGGAIYVEDGGKVTVNGASFTGNSAGKGKDIYAEVKNDITLNNVTLSMQYEREFNANICKMNVILSGEIGVVYHTKVAEKYLDGSFVLSTGTGETVTYKISECSKDADGNYLAAYNVSAIEMSEPVNIKVLAKDGTLLAEEAKSIEEYADILMADGSSSAQVKDVVKKLINYGHFAQLACSENDGWTIGSDYARTKVYSNPAVSKNIFELYGFRSVNADEYDIGLQLSLDYKTDLKVYFTADTQPAVTVNGQPVNAEKCTDGRYRITIGGINILNLADSYEIRINSAAVLTVSALSYGNLAMKDSSNSNKMALLAMYELYKSTVDYNKTV